MLWQGICLVLNMVNKIGKLQFCMSMKRSKLLKENFLKQLTTIVETVCNNDETEQELNGHHIDALYNILKQNQRDVNDDTGSKKKTVVVTSDPLALIAEKTNVSRSKEKVVVSLDSEGSEADNF
nr:hypothetical protein [Tanacetum cinerariifolium]